MSGKLNIITGATGLIGSHIAEQLRGAGERVRALVRTTSATAFLQGIGVELAEGDLHDGATIEKALRGGDVVYHCAARVVNWGPWSDFERETVASTSNVVAACRQVATPRLLHVSSVAAYGHPEPATGEQVTEDAPLGQRYWLWDYYSRSKALAEEIVRTFPRVTIVRPSWTYGPRDRITIPRLVPALLERRVPIIGRGDNLLNIIYAGDVAAGAILAANHPGAVGQAYNFSSPGEIRQVDLLNALTDALALPRIQKHVPAFLAMRFAFLKELIAKIVRSRQPPTITRQVVALVTRRTQFSIAKAERELGWRPRMSIQAGVHRSLAWYQQAAPTGLPANFKMPELRPEHSTSNVER
jgi:nucleoside-diphosphate-sugar epimerase